jgi:hypothetical protein
LKTSSVENEKKTDINENTPYRIISNTDEISHGELILKNHNIRNWSEIHASEVKVTGASS